MNNITWQLPNGDTATTTIVDGIDTDAHAAHLKSVGTIPADWVMVAKDTALQTSLASKKADKVRLIEQARDRATVQDVIAHGTQWQADERSQKLLGDAITLALAGLPLPPVWRDSLNNNMTLNSVADLVAVAGAMAEQTNAAYVKSWQLKAQVAAATTAAEVDAISW